MPESLPLPEIRTMADDLAEARGGMQLADRGAGAPPPARGGLPTAGETQPGGRGKSIALPPARKRAAQGLLVSVFLGTLIALALSGAAWGVWSRIPRGSGTIADRIPAEALAYVSVARGTGTLEDALVPVFVEALGMTPEHLGTDWEAAAYVLLPGSAPSEPVPLLLLDPAGGTPALDGAPHIAARRIPSGGTALLPAQSAGRLDGLSGRMLGKERAFRDLSRRLPAGGGAVYVQGGNAIASLLKPFAFFAPEPDGAVLVSLAPPADGARVTGIAAARDGERAAPSGPPTADTAWQTLLSTIPAAAVSVAARPAVHEDIAAWRTAQSGNPSLQEFLRALSERGEDLESLQALLEGPYIAGTLPTADAGIRDGFAILLLTDEGAGAAGDAARLLEDAFRRLGAFFTGAGIPDAAFAEASHRGTTIRYVNFGSPRRSIDYATLDATLLVSTSQGSMHALLDTRRGIRAEGSVGRDPVARTGTPPGPAWSYLRFDPRLVEELPPAWRAVVRGFRSLSLQPVTERTFVGAAALR